MIDTEDEDVITQNTELGRYLTDYQLADEEYPDAHENENDKKYVMIPQIEQGSWTIKEFLKRFKVDVDFSYLKYQNALGKLFPCNTQINKNIQLVQELESEIYCLSPHRNQNRILSNVWYYGSYTCVLMKQIVYGRDPIPDVLESIIECIKLLEELFQLLGKIACDEPKLICEVVSDDDELSMLYDELKKTFSINIYELSEGLSSAESVLSFHLCKQKQGDFRFLVDKHFSYRDNFRNISESRALHIVEGLKNLVAEQLVQFSLRLSVLRLLGNSDYNGSDILRLIETKMSILKEDVFEKWETFCEKHAKETFHSALQERFTHEGRVISNSKNIENAVNNLLRILGETTSSCQSLTLSTTMSKQDALNLLKEQRYLLEKQSEELQALLRLHCSLINKIVKVNKAPVDEIPFTMVQMTSPLPRDDRVDLSTPFREMSESENLQEDEEENAKNGVTDNEQDDLYEIAPLDNAFEPPFEEPSQAEFNSIEFEESRKAMMFQLNQELRKRRDVMRNREKDAYFRRYGRVQEEEVEPEEFLRSHRKDDHQFQYEDEGLLTPDNLSSYDTCDITTVSLSSAFSANLNKMLEIRAYKNNLSTQEDRD